MKSKSMLTGGLCLLSIAILLGCQSQESETAELQLATKTFFGVEEVVRSPEPEAGAVTVKGVVMTVTPEDRMFTMIDVASYKSCGLSDCCLYLPVRWEGDMPLREEVVLVSGAIEATDSGMIFAAYEIRTTELEESL